MLKLAILSVLVLVAWTWGSNDLHMFTTSYKRSHLNTRDVCRTGFGRYWAGAWSCYQGMLVLYYVLGNQPS